MMQQQSTSESQQQQFVSSSPSMMIKEQQQSPLMTMTTGKETMSPGAAVSGSSNQTTTQFRGRKGRRMSTPLKEIPLSCFVALCKANDKVYLGYVTVDVQDEIENELQTIDKLILEQTSLDLDLEDNIDQIVDFIKEFSRKKHYKIIAASVDELSNYLKLSERLWLEEDITPIDYHLLHDRSLEEIAGHQSSVPGDVKERAMHKARRISYMFSKGDMFLDVFNVRMYKKGRKIAPVTLTSLDAYKYVSGGEQYFKMLLDLANRFKNLGGKLVYLNSTNRGGGVALMRHAQIRLFKLLNLDASWIVLDPKMEVFEITKKKFHNLLQGVAPKDVVLTDHDKKVFTDWSRSNAESLLADSNGDLNQANVIVIDDYQPSGLIPFIKQKNPNAKIIYRSHIHIDTSLMKEQDSPQLVTWDFIWNHNRVKDVDIFLSHPIKEFVPDVVPKEKVTLMAASTDLLDGLNKPISEFHTRYYITVFNEILRRDGQEPLDITRPYIIQTARFDPSKGIPDVLDSFRRLRKRWRKNGQDPEKAPQLVLIGHGAIDDPEGVSIMLETKSNIATSSFDKIAQDIKICRLSHNDQMLNALLRKASVAIQLSHKEGLELKVSECLAKGKPMVIYRTGGMPLQVLEGDNCFVIERGNTKEVADKLYQLLTDNQLYETMSRSAKEKLKYEFFTVNNTMQWIYMACKLLEDGYFNGNCEHVKKHMGLHYQYE
ncbi:hypothetical protein ABK040_002266 [Willaertia magna]